MFQKYVYTVCYTTLDGKQLGIGCYPNFKKAYERIEESMKDRYDFLVDLNTKDDTMDYAFEAIKIDCTRYGRYVECRQYTIIRDLLTVYDERETVSFDMVKRMLEKLKKPEDKYNLIGDVM